MDSKKASVVIVGGGPAGLVVAIELGRRGVHCVVFEQSANPPAFPKANSTTSRTMEHEKFFVGPAFAVRNYNFINAPWDDLHAAVEGFMSTYGAGDGAAALAFEQRSG